ncbi:MAG: DUF4783 domain-containing protein [Cyclobacteriaceae bacterium]|nr:DUF4783 domain-containing protein [Cyclobacteriaceae bacterium HetDA_MAG_MS6]
MNRTTLIFLIATFYCSYLMAQGEVVDNIGIAMKASSAKELVKYCGNNVEINIDGVENSYSRSQAESVLRNFFLQNPATDFVYIHQGASEDPKKLKYTIGKYRMKTGSYRVVMFLKKGTDSYLIDTLTLSRES